MVASVAVLGLGLRKLFFGRLRAIEQEVCVRMPTTSMCTIFLIFFFKESYDASGARRLTVSFLRQYVYERGWFAVTETCLCLSLLHDEIGSALIGHMVLLLLLKVFHWLALARTDSVW
jgi:E3 ubiquitin-protein ligase synoviolin